MIHPDDQNGNIKLIAEKLFNNIPTTIMAKSFKEGKQIKSMLSYYGVGTFAMKNLLINIISPKFVLNNPLKELKRFML